MTRLDHTISPAWPACALAGWSAAWLAGRCSPDDVADTLASFGSTVVVPAHVEARSGEAAEPAGRPTDGGVLGLLDVLRGARSLRVALPSPGDPDGLSPAALSAGALDAGEAIVVESPTRGVLALIPQRAEDMCRWSVRPLPDDCLSTGTMTSSGGIAPGEVEYELREAIAEATELIGGLGSRTSMRPADLRSTMYRLTAGNQVDLPPHDDPRPGRIVDRAAQVEAIVTLAQDSTFGLTAGHGEAGAAQLTRLRTLARRARSAAVNRVVEEFLRNRN